MCLDELPGFKSPNCGVCVIVRSSHVSLVTPTVCANVPSSNELYAKLFNIHKNELCNFCIAFIVSKYNVLQRVWR